MVTNGNESPGTGKGGRAVLEQHNGRGEEGERQWLTSGPHDSGGAAAAVCEKEGIRVWISWYITGVVGLDPTLDLDLMATNLDIFFTENSSGRFSRQ